MAKATKHKNIFAKRLRDLIRDKGCTHEAVATAVGVTRQGVGKWVNGDSVPDVLTAAKISKFFEVSVDYLAGNVNYPSIDPKIQAVCEYTGLSQSNILLLNKLNEAKQMMYKAFETITGTTDMNTMLNILDPHINTGAFDISIISVMLDVLDSYPTIIDNIRVAAGVDVNNDNIPEIEKALAEYDNSSKNPSGEKILDKIHENGTILSGYYYKRYLIQSIVDEGVRFWQEVVNKIAPNENLFHDDNGNTCERNYVTQNDESQKGLYENACDTVNGYKFMIQALTRGEGLIDDTDPDSNELDNAEEIDLSELEELLNGFDKTEKE